MGEAEGWLQGRVEGLHAALVVEGMVIHVKKVKVIWRLGCSSSSIHTPVIVTGHHISRHFQLIVPRKEDGPDTT